MAKPSKRKEQRARAKAKSSARRASRELLVTLEQNLTKTFMSWAAPVFAKHGMTPESKAEQVRAWEIARRVWNRPAAEARLTPEQRASASGAFRLPPEGTKVREMMDELVSRRQALMRHEPWIIERVRVVADDQGEMSVHIVSELQRIVPPLAMKLMLQGDYEQLTQTVVLALARDTLQEAVQSAQERAKVTRPVVAVEP